MGFRVWGLGIRVPSWGTLNKRGRLIMKTYLRDHVASPKGPWGLGFGVKGLGSMGFRVWGLGFRVDGV